MFLALTAVLTFINQLIQLLKNLGRLEHKRPVLGTHYLFAIGKARSKNGSKNGDIPREVAIFSGFRTAWIRDSKNTEIDGRERPIALVEPHRGIISGPERRHSFLQVPFGTADLEGYDSAQALPGDIGFRSISPPVLWPGGTRLAGPPCHRSLLNPRFRVRSLAGSCAAMHGAGQWSPRIGENRQGSSDSTNAFPRGFVLGGHPFQVCVPGPGPREPD
jgi:hypothetical protein